MIGLLLSVPWISCSSQRPEVAEVADSDLSLELGSQDLVSVNPVRNPRLGLEGFVLSMQHKREAVLRIAYRVEGAWRTHEFVLPLKAGEWLRGVKGTFGREFIAVFRGSVYRRGEDTLEWTRVSILDAKSGKTVREHVLEALSSRRPCLSLSKSEGSLWATLSKEESVWVELDLESGSISPTRVRTAPQDWPAEELVYGLWPGRGSLAYSAVSHVLSVDGRGTTYRYGDSFARVFGPAGTPSKISEFWRPDASVLDPQCLVAVDKSNSVALYLGMPYSPRDVSDQGMIAEWTPGAGGKGHRREFWSDQLVGLGQALAVRSGRVYALGAMKPKAWGKEDKENLAIDYIYHPWVDAAYCLETGEIFKFDRLEPPFSLLNLKDGLFVLGRSGTTMRAIRVVN